MVKHIILWQLKDTLSAEEAAAVKQGIKEGLEGLQGKIDGLTAIHVQTDCLPTSKRDCAVSTRSISNYKIYFERIKSHFYAFDRSIERFQVNTAV